LANINRTFMELKPGNGRAAVLVGWHINRTFMELKLQDRVVEWPKNLYGIETTLANR
jgi:hypothetical protein